MGFHELQRLSIARESSVSTSAMPTSVLASMSARTALPNWAGAGLAARRWQDGSVKCGMGRDRLHKDPLSVFFPRDR